MKKKTTDSQSKPEKKVVRSPAWILYCRVDPALEPQVKKFIDSHELKPNLARVVERALKLYLESKSFWPPDDDDA